MEPQDCVALARHIHQQCQHLRFAGLMTIGMPGQFSCGLQGEQAGLRAWSGRVLSAAFSGCCFLWVLLSLGRAFSALLPCASCQTGG